MPYNLTNAFPSLVNATSIASSFDCIDGAVNAFANLETVTGELRLDGSTSPIYAAPAPTLPALTSAGRLALSGFTFAASPVLAPVLTTLTNELAIVNCEIPSGFPTFASLAVADKISLNNNILNGNWSLGASHFPVLVELTHAGSPLEIYYNEGLMSLAGAFPALAIPGGSPSTVFIANNSTLTTLANAFPAFNSSIATWLLEIYDNAVLTSIAGAFSGPGFTAESVRVFNNPLLTDMSNFWQLACDGVIEIDNNDSLEVCLGSFPNVVGSALTAIYINNNALLPTTAQAQALINLFVADGFVGTQQNTNNLPPPET